MPGYHRMDKFIVTEYRDGCVYKTKKVSDQWFKLDECPEAYMIKDDVMWVNTNDYYFGPDDPRKA